jgi:MFS superfamily sulfate permease-like transporter
MNFLSKVSAPSRNDIVASLGVFTIAVPLSLGIALASGVPASSAIVTAIVGGLVVGLISGAPLVVSGPAAGLAALVLQYVQQFGLTGLAIITIMAGLFQISLGAARFGRFFNLVPKSVLQGMLAAIGVIIAMGQVHVLIGQAVPSSVTAAITTLPDALLRTAASPIGIIISCLGLAAIALQIFWPKVSGKLSWLPGALPAVFVITLVSMLWDVPRVQFTSIIADAQVSIANLFSSVAPWASVGIYLLPAIGLALVASAETLLTARAVDTLAAANGIKSNAKLDTEMIAQGVGNSISGILGGMPMTGVIVRSAANLNFGAETRWSTVLHGAWIFVAVIALPFVVTAIPLTALAAVLVITGFKLLNPTQVAAIFRSSRVEGTLWFVTFAAILATDLLKGLAIALAAAVVAHYGKSIVPYGRRVFKPMDEMSRLSRQESPEPTQPS